MDSIVYAAIEEVCVRAAAGIPVTELWPSLRGVLSAAGLPPGNAVHKAIWVRFLSLQGIRFEAQGSRLCAQDPSIQSLGEAERIGVRIVAEDHLRDSFLGIYDLKASTSEISQIQRAVLERLAAARTKGVTQSELAKEFGIKANSFFYIVRNLECQQLIVRQSTIVRAKETAAERDNAPKNISAVSTNLLLLRRYAKNLSLNSQQKFEITKGDSLEGMGHNGGSSSSVGESSADFAKGDLSVKDYLPAIKAICDKLEESCGKVLVVSDIKSSLGYRKSTGHRAWRSVLNRLKDAHLVEEFQGEVNKKVVSCLRLLKKFDSSDFLHKKGMNSHDSFGNENLTKIGKRGDITDEFVELPTDSCIYDMVDAEGERGLTIPEISIRLGFTSKKLHKRLSSMRERFGMCWQAEIHERTPVYRIWTFENYPYHPPGTSLAKNEAKRDKNVFFFHSNNSTSPLCQSIVPCSTNDALSLVEKNCVSMQLVHCNISPGPDGAAEGIKCSTDQQRNTIELPILSCVPKSESTVATAVNNAHQIEKYHIDSSTSPDVKAVQRNRLLLTLVNTRREERIIKKLQKEKFVLMAELYRWLEELDKGKKTKMCRKTLTKTLNRLQKKGLCKCIQVSIPVVTNFNRHRASEVILHPSVENLSPEILEKIYRKQRDFDIRIRVQASAKCRNGQSVQNLSSLSMASLNVDDKSVCLEAMRANGFVSARMVRAKLLHKFLWSYVNNSPNWHDSVNANHCRDDLKSLQNTCHLFSLDEAVKMMPLELFLQVVGSPKEIDSMVERCRLGLRLSDIPSSEYKSLFDIGATSRLSNIINVLVRMKLIQLVREGLAEDGNDLHAILTYAMELRPYIEEPVARTIRPSYIKPDLRPRIRHDFLLLMLEAVDVYWETLEYCFVAADKEAASHAFPGSCAHEVFRSRSWTSLRVMTAEQRMELLKLLDTLDAKKKVSFKDCIKIAREVKLTVEQVIRVSYDRRKSRPYTYSSRLNSKRSENHIDGDKGESFNIKRKRSLGSEESSLEEIEKGFNKLKKSNASGVNAQNTERVISSPANEIQLSASKDLNNVDHAVDTKMLVEHVRRHGLLSRAKQIPKRAKRFFWNDRLDRQLVMQYSRHRAISGARFYRVDWTSLADLPALPATCCRRMALLNSNCNIRRAVMRLCNLLGERYAMYLERVRMIEEKEPVSQNSSLTYESYSESNLSQYFWDNFEDPDVKITVDEVLRYKRLTKFGSVKRLGLKHGKRWPVIPPVDGTNTNSQIASDEQNKISKSGSTESQQHIAQRKKLTASNMSRSHHSQGNLVKVLNKRCNIMKREVCESLAIANAIELLKVVLLGTSASPEVQCSLVATLQLYSENDIVGAFTYLKEKNFIVVGHGSRRFVLSKKFWHHASSSPFPIDSGKRADDFSSWLSKQEGSLMEDGINLTQDLQCGEICHLFALVSSGELSISPCLPNEGIGEADEPPEDDNTTYSNNLKRKSSEVELRDHKKVKKLRLGMIIDNDYCSRREKGFPGIRVVIDRQTISEADTYMTLRVQENLKSSLSYDSNCKELSCEANCTPLLSNYQNSGGSIVLDKLPWADIISYAEYLSSVHLGTNKATNFSPELFINVHSAVCQAGERGMDMQEISEAVDKQGRQLATVAVDTLEVFQVVIKVNSYENIRVLDSSYKSKYFIQSAGSPHEKMSLFTRSGVTKFGACHQNFGRKTGDAHNCEEPSKNLCDGHKVTILDLPSDSVVVDLQGSQDNKSCATLSNETMQVADSGQGKPVEETMQVADADQGKHFDDKNNTIVSSTQICCPILPWINGDGSTNTIVYKGLTRRLFGTIMQNPSILEEDIIRQMDVLNPQSCRRLLELMILDSHLTVRKLPQTPSSAPAILQSIFGPRLSNAQPVFRKHFFANPLSTTLL